MCRVQGKICVSGEEEGLRGWGEEGCGKGEFESLWMNAYSDSNLPTLTNGDKDHGMGDKIPC